MKQAIIALMFLLTIASGITVTGASDSSFVSGPVKKTGNQTFTFPTGKGTHYHR